MQTKFTTSVNIIRDSKRDLNYIPTPNANMVVNQICNDFKKGTHSFNIIGNYGTGKSSFLCAFQQTLTGIKKHFNINLLPDPKIDFINIIGNYKSIVETFADKFDIKTNNNISENILSGIYNHYHSLGKNNPILLIFIDEFGKFLEYAVQNEPEKELYFIQQLAEFVNNPNYNIILLTTVHQNFDAYTISLKQTQKQEWTKVKGRFREIIFNEPVEQLLFLASEHLTKRETANKVIKDITATVELLKNSKAFHTNIDYVSEIAEKLYPLDIFSANVITSALQKYGQNERSLFSFLESTDNTGIIYHSQESKEFYNIPNVYDYLIFNSYSFINSKFNPDFAAWKSIKNSLENVENTYDGDVLNYFKIIKTIGLLNLSSVNGSKLDKEFLANYCRLCLKIKNPESLIDNLIKKKIIFYRNYNSRYVLTEGTDLDIETALIEAGNKVSDVTDITYFINKNYQLPPVIAKEETYKKGTPRLFEYRITEFPIIEIPKGEIDGFVNLIFNDKITLTELLEHSKNIEEAILYGYYKNSKSIKDLLFEIEKTKKVIEENNEDKVAVRELNNIVNHQQNLLTHKILNNFYNSKKEVIWIFKGEELEIKSKKEFNKHLSLICNKVYYKAPKFNNELANKHKISASIHSAKRNYIKALVNNWNKPDLDFPKDNFPPEKTIYLSLLKQNGIELYFEDINKGIKVNEDNNFHLLWNESMLFLQSAKSSKRRISEFNDILSRKPYKLKQGLIDFWIPTFLFINRDDYALFNENGYIPYINVEVLELIVKDSDNYEIKTFAIDGVKLNLFNSYRLFLNQNSKKNISNDTFIETIKPFLTFYKGLPDYSKHTKRLSKEAIKIREAIAKAKDPEQTFFEDFPGALNFRIENLQNSKDNLQKYILKLQDAIRELRTSYDELINRVEEFIQAEIIGESIPFEDYKLKLQYRFKKLKKHLLLPAQKTFILRLDSQLDDKKAWFNSLVQSLIGVTLEKLTDDEEVLLYDKFKSMIFELDSLTNISKSDFSEDKEDVVSLEINSFISGFSKKIVRLPKKKRQEIETISVTIRNNLSNDRILNIAALTNLLKELLKNE